MVKILFVEDNANAARAAKVLLELRGYTTDIAESVAKAKACLSTNSYDLLISDIRLPDGTGYDLLAGLPKTTRAIALSGFTSHADRSEALAKGFAEFVTKPFRTEDLIAAIERVMSLES
ncbi:MAG TPA: response regulator [Candidatus Kapabacteria bacterium]|nr:response regulator [Candidatus Kapabacteria bacterium]